MYNEPIRILHVLTAMDCAGTETMLMNLYRNIDREKIQFDFAVSVKKHCDYDDEILKMGGRIIHYPRYTPINHFAYTKWWKKYFKTHPEHKIVHGHIGSTASIYLKIAKANGCYTIAHSHSIMNRHKSFRDVIYKIYSYPTRFIADFFFACSVGAGIDRYGKKVVSSKNFKVLNNSIEAKNFIFSNHKREKTRQEFSIPETSFVIGTIGRFSEEKNHRFIIDIFREIKKNCSNAKLILIGDGKLRSSVAACAAQEVWADDIIFTGIRKDIPDLLCAMDVFLFPSLFEGLGIAAVEAQASGLHTICSDRLPIESKVSDLAEYFSLNESPLFWANQVLKYNNDYARNNMQEIIEKSGYDISDTSRWLTDFYLYHAGT